MYRETTIMGSIGFRVCRPLINKPPPLDRDYHRDPNIKALKRRGFINHGNHGVSRGLHYHLRYPSGP